MGLAIYTPLQIRNNIDRYAYKTITSIDMHIKHTHIYRQGTVNLVMHGCTHNQLDLMTRKSSLIIILCCYEGVYIDIRQ